MTEHLLRPSLAATSSAPTLYSARSSFVLAFLMGPAPLILYSAVNSVRLRRRADFLIYAIAMAIFIALVYSSHMSPRPDAIVWMNALLGETSSMRGTMRILAIVLWGGFYLMHRKEHRAATLMTDHPSPWIAAILCALGGTVLALLFSVLFKVIQ